MKTLLTLASALIISASAFALELEKAPCQTHLNKVEQRALTLGLNLELI